jgi:hypothetical protein
MANAALLRMKASNPKVTPSSDYAPLTTPTHGQSRSNR